MGPISGSDSELDNETPQEKRLRLAKEYLSQVEAEGILKPAHYLQSIVCDLSTYLIALPLIENGLIDVTLRKFSLYISLVVI